MKESDFLYPLYPYRGHYTQKNLAFNANLQDFSQKVSYICNLETTGKLSPYQAYRKINFLWKQLKDSKKQLGI